MDVSKLVEKARSCVEMRNYDYAIENYLQALMLSPNDVGARKELRAVAVRNVKENGISKVTGILRGLVPLVKLLLPSKDQDRRMIACEQYLTNDPGNIRILTKLGQAALRAGHKETAVWVFEDLMHNNPDSGEAARTLARTYEFVGMTGEALDTYKRLEKLKPGDREAQTKVRDLSARGMTEHIQDATTGDVTGQRTRKVLRDDKETLRRQLDESGGRTPDEIKQIIGFIKEDIDNKPDDPNVHNLWVRLGDQHMRIKEFDEANDCYLKAQSLSPTEYRIKMKLQDVEMAKMRAPIGELSEKIKAGQGDADAKKKLQQLEAKYYKYRLDCFMERERNYVTDLSIAFELGNLYYRFKQYAEAAKRYQRTQNDPGRRAQSLVRLGICFSSMDQDHLAEEAFTNGVDGIELAIGQSEIKKELTYHRGCLYERLGRKDDARKDFEAIFSVDIAFRDVGDRLNQLK